ncbi:dhpH [Scenedesmus sp. PABB004]|nr:dhpH [Scenedesmus sp. PABB004]
MSGSSSEASVGATTPTGSLSSVARLSASPAGSEEAGFTAIVVGGGIAGLLAGLSLQALGCDAHIYEAAPKAPASASGDVAYLLTEELTGWLAAHKIALERKAFRTEGRQVLAEDGEVALQDARQQTYISWRALHSALLEAFPKDNYHADARVTGVDASHPDVVVIELASGERIAGHMLVAADGPTSCVRAQLLPSCQPAYAGYLAWRGVGHIDRLSPEAQHCLADKGTMFKGPNLHMHVHPLPLADGCGEGQPLAWTWFNNQAEEELPGLLLDHDLRRYDAAVPLGSLNAAVADAVAAAAADALPPPLAELVACSVGSMGVAAVRDLALPCQAVGRVAFVGESGCVLRPHGTSSVDKALLDVSGLTATLRGFKLCIEKALPRWDAQHLPRSVALCSAAAAAGNRLQGTDDC